MIKFQYVVRCSIRISVPGVVAYIRRGRNISSTFLYCGFVYVVFQKPGLQH